MNVILEFLNSPISLLFGMATTPAELMGFVTGALAVYLVAVNNIWTWPVGIVNAGFFFVLFLDARLYTDAYLQVFFVVSCFFGWYMWLKAGPHRTKLKVRHITPAIAAVAVVGIGLFIYFMQPVLLEAHGSYPLADSSTTGLSVAAQLIMGLKMIENWALWIGADLIYIPLYAFKGLYFTSILYVVFLLLCLKGVHHWYGVLQEQKREADGKPITMLMTEPTGNAYDDTVAGVRA